MHLLLPTQAARLAATALLLLSMACAGLRGAPAPAMDPIPGPLFRFESSFWVNLHHLLIRETERGGKSSEPMLGLALTAEESAAWETALAHYRDHFASRSPLFDAGMRELRDALTAAAESTSLPETGLDPATRAVLDRVAPLYRRTLWPDHDRANRDRISQLERFAAEHSGLAPRLTAIFGSSWPVEPVRVDVVIYATWSGAYTTIEPTHITLQAADARQTETLGLETLFHEASHGLIEPVAAAIRAERNRQGREAPRRDDLWHAVLFYTVGWAVQRDLPEHTPYAEKHGLWDRGWQTHLAVIRRHWQPYLDGRVGFDDAISGMVREL